MNTEQGAGSRLVALTMLGVISALSAQETEEVRQAEEPVGMLAGSFLSGYIDTSAIWMFGKGTILYGRSFDGGSNSQENKQDGFNLNVAKIQLEKQPEVDGWSSGYVASLLFGPDANTIGTTSIGAVAKDVAIREAYVSLRAPVGNGFMVKLG